MNKIFDDQSKFKRLSPVTSNDNTASIESRLLDLVKADLIPKWIYDAISPIRSQRPQMYGLPKTHKGTPLDAVHKDSDLQPLIPKDMFVELMKSTTWSVEFSFNNTVYKQTNGVAMGSPLGLALANIFAGYYEEKFFS